MGRRKKGNETITTGWEIDLGLDELTEVLLEADCFSIHHKDEHFGYGGMYEIEVGDIFIKDEE